MTDDEVLLLDIARQSFLEDHDVERALEEFIEGYIRAAEGMHSRPQIEILKRELIERLDFLAGQAECRAMRWLTVESKEEDAMDARKLAMESA